MAENVTHSIRMQLVKEVMTSHPVTIDLEKTVMETAMTMSRLSISSLIVTATQGGNEKAVGIVTERDLVRRVLAKEGDTSKLRLREIMSSPLIVVNPRDTIEEAATTMKDHRVRRLAVMDQGLLVGMITVVDLAKALAKQLEYSDVVFNAMARVSKAMSEAEVGELEARLSVARRELEVAKATIEDLEQQLSKYKAKTRES